MLRDHRILHIQFCIDSEQKKSTAGFIMPEHSAYSSFVTACTWSVVVVIASVWW